jgi:FlaG/FlaF family flagellin (archaellin)
MKKATICFISLTLILMATGYSFAQGTYSGAAVTESGKAASHASKSVVNSIAASGQATSAVSAIPLAVSAAAGAVSGQAAQGLIDSATQPIGKPLPISDETFTAGPPPDQVLKMKSQQQ